MTFQKEHTPWNKGRTGVYSDESLQRNADAHRGKPSGMRGKHPSEETIKKLSEAHRGKTHSEETKRKMSEARKGRVLTEEHRKNISKAGKGKVISEEHRRKLSERVVSEVTKKRISVANSGENHPMFGKHHSEKTKIKMGIGNKGKRKGVIPWMKGKHHTEETIRKSSELHKILSAGDRNPRWIDGRSFLPYCNKFNDELKEHIRERDNRICQSCGEKENGRKLDVHHIHYDKPNCDPDLIALCMRCNVKANSNRDYWEGYFMNKLKERGLVS